MGNASTKESRTGDGGHRGHHLSGTAREGGSGASSSRRNRSNRGDIGGILGLGSGGGSQLEPPYERRETKQEREARRLERDRVARIAERERSMKEEHVDGGYLVTMGTYSSPEDFNKQIVRQLLVGVPIPQSRHGRLVLTPPLDRAEAGPFLAWSQRFQQPMD